MLIIPAVGAQRQDEPRDPLTSQSSRNSELQVQWETLSKKKKKTTCGDMIEENIPMSSSGLHMCLLTHFAKCNAYTRTHTHLGITFSLLGTKTNNAEYLLRLISRLNITKKSLGDLEHRSVETSKPEIQTNTQTKKSSERNLQKL